MLGMYESLTHASLAFQVIQEAIDGWDKRLLQIGGRHKDASAIRLRRDEAVREYENMLRLFAVPPGKIPVLPRR